MKMMAKPLGVPPTAAVNAIQKGGFIPRAVMPEAVPLKSQPKQAIALPGGGVALVKSKTWW